MIYDQLVTPNIDLSVNDNNQSPSKKLTLLTDLNARVNTLITTIDFLTNHMTILVASHQQLTQQVKSLEKQVTLLRNPENNMKHLEGLAKTVSLPDSLDTLLIDFEFINSDEEELNDLNSSLIKYRQQPDKDNQGVAFKAIIEHKEKIEQVQSVSLLDQIRAHKRTELRRTKTLEQKAPYQFCLRASHKRLIEKSFGQTLSALNIKVGSIIEQLEQFEDIFVQDELNESHLSMCHSMINEVGSLNSNHLLTMVHYYQFFKSQIENKISLKSTEKALNRQQVTAHEALICEKNQETQQENFTQLKKHAISKLEGLSSIEQKYQALEGVKLKIFETSFHRENGKLPYKDKFNHVQDFLIQYNQLLHAIKNSQCLAELEQIYHSHQYTRLRTFSCAMHK